jgi:3-oxoacyl-[acyl-carrier-protein] synthase III
VTLHLHALGHFHPENEITNRFLEELDIGTTDAWIVERVGIHARRTVLPLDYIRATRNRDPRAALEAALYSNAQLAARAAEHALARAGIDRSEIGMVISGSSSTQSLTPAEACLVAHELRVETMGFDLNSACTSFLAALHVLSMMRPERLPRFVLITAVDSMTTLCDYSDRASAVLWGDGAAAALVSPHEPGPARFLATELSSSPAGAGHVVVPRHGTFSQNGRIVQAFAIRKTAEGLARIAELSAEAGDRTLHFAGHQANLLVLEACCARLGIPSERHHTNVERFGNTGAPSAPSVLSMHFEKWGPRDDVAVVGVGGGLSWGRALLRFGAES